MLFYISFLNPRRWDESDSSNSKLNRCTVCPPDSFELDSPNQPTTQPTLTHVRETHRRVEATYRLHRPVFF